MQQTRYLQNYYLMNQQNFDNPQTLALMKKDDSKAFLGDMNSISFKWQAMLFFWGLPYYINIIAIHLRKNEIVYNYW